MNIAAVKHQHFSIVTVSMLSHSYAQAGKNLTRATSILLIYIKSSVIHHLFYVILQI